MPGADLHIVTFSVPYPPTYGGAMEVWNRLKALNKEGIRINLHCFVYGAYLPHKAIKEVTNEVHYYPRSVWPVLFTKGMPFVVSSRMSKPLLHRLQADHVPVLFEGMQTTGWVNEISRKKRLLRAHNVEHKYYQQLAENSWGLRSMIYSREAQCLEEYEKQKAKIFDTVFSISAADHEWFLRQGGNSVHLSPFHGFLKTTISSGRGNFILYQGDLSIEINQRAVLDLIRMIPNGFEMPLVVAGRSGDRQFEAKLTAIPNIRRQSDVSQEQMATLIRDAQVIFIHSLHAEGMKMKIYPALFQGRFIAANLSSKTNSPLDDVIHFYEPGSFATVLQNLKSKEFTISDQLERERVLSSIPDDQTRAREIIKHL